MTELVCQRMRPYLTGFLSMLLLVGCIPLHSQNETFNLEKTNESILKNKQLINSQLVGVFGNHPVFLTNKFGTPLLYTLDESKNLVHELKMFTITNGERLSDFNVSDSAFFYTEAIFSDINDDGYKRIYLMKGKRSLLLDSIYFADKKVHSTFSTDNRTLIINTLPYSKDYYKSASDDRMTTYELIQNASSFKRSFTPCKHCGNAHLVPQGVYYTIAEEKDVFNNEFAYTNIYQSQMNNLSDTIRIASFSRIVSTTPDGEYILATRIGDLPNNQLAIIDVRRKKYQLLLGREYGKMQPFFSSARQKFGFVFEDTIIYVDFPKSFPFDALSKHNHTIPDWTNKSFYSKFKHLPLQN